MAILKIRSRIIEEKPNCYIVECGSCNGKGMSLNDPSDYCITCNGTGSVLLTIPSEWKNDDIGLAKCAACDGNGRYPFDISFGCKTCSGVGVLVKAFPRLSCEACKGSGRYLDDNIHRCKDCDGVGSIWIEDIIDM